MRCAPGVLPMLLLVRAAHPTGTNDVGSANQPAQVRENKDHRSGKDYPSGLADFALFEHGRLPFFLLAQLSVPEPCTSLETASRLGVEYMNRSGKTPAATP